MNFETNRSYPPLRRKILRNFLWIILSYILLGLILMSAVFFASSLTPKLIHVNYDSIAATHRMREAWINLRHFEDHPEKKQQEWTQQFDEALTFELSNITEPGERQVAEQIQALWNQTKANPIQISSQQFSQMLKNLDQLVEVNEKGMFNLASRSRQISQQIFWAALGFFLLTVLLSVLLADNLSHRLALPIKSIAEILRSKPSLEKRLKLPDSNTLELSILSRQLTDLWDQLSKLNKLNLRQLVAQRNQLESVLASVEDGILVLNQEDKVVLANEGIAQVLGVKQENLLNQSWKDLPTLNPNYLLLRDFLVPEISSFSSVELQLEGAKKIFAGRTRQILGEGNKPIGSLYLLHDITQKVKMQTLKEEFISVLSHELKTPLQSLGTAGELLYARRIKMDEESKSLVETLNEDISRIRAISNDFIQMGQPEATVLKLHLKEICLNRAIEEWIKPFKILAQDKKIEIEFFQKNIEPIWARLDVIKFPWVISNLFSNAIRVSHPETKIQLTLAKSDSEVILEVADEGPGVPATLQKKIFEPYYQGPQVDREQVQGFLGIGLTIVKEVVEAHGGWIEYEQRQPKGSIFRIILPLFPSILQEGSNV